MKSVEAWKEWKGNMLTLIKQKSVFIEPERDGHTVGDGIRLRWCSQCRVK